MHTDYYPCYTPEEVCKFIEMIGKRNIVSVTWAKLPDTRDIFYIFYQMEIEQKENKIIIGGKSEKLPGDQANWDRDPLDFSI